MLSGHSQPLALHPDSSLWAVVLALLTEVGLQPPKPPPPEALKGRGCQTRDPLHGTHRVPSHARLSWGLWELFCRLSGTQVASPWPP